MTGTHGQSASPDRDGDEDPVPIDPVRKRAHRMFLHGKSMIISLVSVVVVDRVEMCALHTRRANVAMASTMVHRC
jgi:hypothetical protein